MSNTFSLKGKAVPVTGRTGMLGNSLANRIVDADRLLLSEFKPGSILTSLTPVDYCVVLFQSVPDRKTAIMFYPIL